MSRFCIDTIAPDAGLRAQHGLLRAESFAVTGDARLAAERILRKAGSEADNLIQRAQDQARAVVQDAEQDTFARAERLLLTLEQMRETFLDRAQDLVIELAQGLFDRLVCEMTPRERLLAALKRVQREAPPRLVYPMLRLHPDELDLAPSCEWEVKADPSLSAGMCRLEASNGEWCVDFGGAVSALKSALSDAMGERKMSSDGVRPEGVDRQRNQTRPQARRGE